jgi:hypothetical protein
MISRSFRCEASYTLFHRRRALGKEDMVCSNKE